MQSTFFRDLFNFEFAYFRNMFREVSLIDSFDIGPVILDGNFFKLCLVLIVPGSHSSALFFSESSGACEIILSTVSHLDVLGDEVFIGDFSVALDYCKLLLILAHGY